MTFPKNISLSKEIKDLLTKLLCKDPYYRLGCVNGIKDILTHSWFSCIRIKDLADKNITPPYKPHAIEFNFDEEEFAKGD